MDEKDNAIQIFENEAFGQIRTLLRDGEPWFVAVDICTALDLNPNATRRLDEDEKMTLRLTYGQTGQRGGARSVNIVNEYGLYALILGSRKPEAKQFKRWITHEVIPSIRKHGAYMTSSMIEQILQNPELIGILARELVEEQRQKTAFQEALAMAQPKADYFDQFVNPKDCTTIRNTAKELGIPEKRFIAFLVDHRYMYRDKGRKLMPYAEYCKHGYFTLRDYYRSNGTMHQYSLLTAKGKDYFRLLMTKERGWKR